MSDPEFITVKEACRIIGGDKPISPATFYRAVNAGHLPAPERVTPGISRVRRQRLIEALSAKGATS
jgi:predicted DNA-binding transcriptional regulator AlpA